jgi:hypothetical protein
MWGWSATVQLPRAALLALGLAAACGGRSTRDLPAGGSGGGGSGQSGAGGSSGGVSVLRPCGVAPLSVEMQPPVMILLEASEVMAGAAPGGGAHFDTARLVTRALLDTLREGTRVGLAVATQGGRMEACSDPGSLVAPRPLDAAHRRAMAAVLDDAVPGGPSALLGTYDAVLGALLSYQGNSAPATVIVVGSGSTARGVACGIATFAWLAPELEGRAADANASGTDTFAIGVAGTMEERRILSALAIAGGTAPPTCKPEYHPSCYFDLVDGSDVRLGLERALRETAVRSPSVCQFELASIPAERVLDPELLAFSVRVDDRFTLLERVSPGPCSTGWQLSEDGASVILCADTCGAFRSDPNVTLEVALACDGPPPRN